MITTLLVSSPSAARGALHEGVWALLRDVDDEFVPRLSSRSDTVSTVPSVDTTLAAYVDALRMESWIVASDSAGVVGVVSFVSGYCQPPLERWAPSAYVTTVAVTGARRRQGVATAMYEKLIIGAREAGLPWVTTRTWSTNTSHLGLLRQLGFREVMRMSADREPGVDTVYLARPIGREQGREP